MRCSKPCNWDIVYLHHHLFRRNVQLYMRFRVQWQPDSNMWQQWSVHLRELPAGYANSWAFLCISGGLLSAGNLVRGHDVAVPKPLELSWGQTEVVGVGCGESSGDAATVGHIASLQNLVYVWASFPCHLYKLQQENSRKISCSTCCAGRIVPVRDAHTQCSSTTHGCSGCRYGNNTSASRTMVYYIYGTVSFVLS